MSQLSRTHAYCIAFSNGEQFFRLLRDSASSPDCVNPVNVFDVEKRERFSMVDLNAIDINPGCVGDEYMCAYSHCPESYDCLGRFCRVEGDARGCSFHLDYVRGIQPSREEGCPAAEECNVVGTDAARCQRGEYVCAFCRGAASDGTLGSDCVAFPELTTQEECESAVICELPGGKVTIASSEKHCREMNGHCNVACKGFSCKSHNAQETVCSAHNIQNAMECGSLNQELAGSSENVSWVNEEICVAQYASKSLDGCSQVCFNFSYAQVAKTSQAFLIFTDTLEASTAIPVGRVPVERLRGVDRARLSSEQPTDAIYAVLSGYLEGVHKRGGVCSGQR